MFTLHPNLKDMNISKNTVFIILLVAVAALSRLVPHIPNFTPIAAIGLVAASYFKKNHSAFVVPIFAMLLSDFFIGFHSTMFWVYGSLIAIVFLGQFLLKKVSVLNVVLSALISSILFFVITNFGVWVSYDFYAKNWAGFTECYLMAIPFFVNTLMGDAFYCTVLFGVIFAVQKYVFKSRLVFAEV